MRDYCERYVCLARDMLLVDSKTAPFVMLPCLCNMLIHFFSCQLFLLSGDPNFCSDVCVAWQHSSKFDSILPHAVLTSLQMAVFHSWRRVMSAAAGWEGRWILVSKLLVCKYILPVSKFPFLALRMFVHIATCTFVLLNHSKGKPWNKLVLTIIALLLSSCTILFVHSYSSTW